eukprot:TRINITY_DN2933_c0_g1_i5.p1 TRINITY_DN2933_c0_g1~~TRINITY_DN2933_c0_g1_i5.p1  ORF type:complete len:127 (+),score=23.35 TRINITY_DN2933_c0_g1_i5:175-555(+)
MCLLVKVEKAASTIGTRVTEGHEFLDLSPAGSLTARSYKYWSARLKRDRSLVKPAMVKKIKEFKDVNAHVAQTWDNSEEGLEEDDYEAFQRWQEINKQLEPYNVCVSIQENKSELLHLFHEVNKKR